MSLGVGETQLLNSFLRAQTNFYEVTYSTRHEIPDQVSFVNGFLTKIIFFYNFKFYDIIMNFVCYNK